MAGCPARPAASSCSPPPRRSSSPTATTPRRWTTSPSGPGCPSRCCTSTSRASSSCTWPCWTPRPRRSARPCTTRWPRPTTTAQRVHGVLTAYFDFVDRGEEDGAFRLIFETDLGNEPAVRDRVEAVAQQDDAGGRRHRRRRHRAGRDPGRAALDRADRRRAGGRTVVARQRPVRSRRPRRSGCWRRCCGGASPTSPARANTDRSHTIVECEGRWGPPGSTICFAQG